MARKFPNRPSGGGGSNTNMLKQAQKMQEDMLKLQEELETREFSAKAGGGVVEAVVNGKHELRALNIDPEAVDPEDVEMLSDMILAAVNEANRVAAAAAEEDMAKITGGMALPGLF